MDSNTVLDQKMFLKENWDLDHNWKNGFLNGIKDFDNFRHIPYVDGVVENTTEAWVNDNLRFFQESSLMKHRDKFRTSDTIGNPKIFEFEGVGEFAPTTLRYVMTLSRIVEAFGSLRNYTIAEIGAGYGGLCKIIHDVFRIKKYYLFDLPEVLSVQKRYLSNFGIQTEENQAIDEPIDLVIATCSWTEFTPEVRELYFNNVISRARQGFFMMNVCIPECLALLKEKIICQDHIQYFPIYIWHNQNLKNGITGN